MVDVEQSALRALEQDALALPALQVEQRPDRIDIGKNLRRYLGELSSQIVGGNLGLAETATKRIVVG